MKSARGFRRLSLLAFAGSVSAALLAFLVLPERISVRILGVAASEAAPARPGNAGRGATGDYTGRTMLGVFLDGDSMALLFEFERHIGRQVDGLLAYAHDDRWSNMGPQSHLTSPLGRSGRGLLWSMPHYTSKDGKKGGLADMREVAAGKRNAEFRRWAQEILAHGRPASDGNYYVRTTWELPGEWFQWTESIVKDPEAYKRSFCQYARSLRSVSERFKMVWDFNSDRGPVERYYPGDDCVDVISQDIYWDPELQGRDPMAAWRKHLHGYGRGLAWMADFAAKRGKPMAISEFGVNQSVPGAAIWLEQFNKWVQGHNVVYVTYWYAHQESAFAGYFSSPQIGSVMRKYYGQKKW